MSRGKAEVWSFVLVFGPVIAVQLLCWHYGTTLEAWLGIDAWWHAHVTVPMQEWLR